jgi:hypothetical protein
MPSDSYNPKDIIPLALLGRAAEKQLRAALAGSEQAGT